MASTSTSSSLLRKEMALSRQPIRNSEGLEKAQMPLPASTVPCAHIGPRHRLTARPAGRGAARGRQAARAPIPPLGRAARAAAATPRLGPAPPPPSSAPSPAPSLPLPRQRRQGGGSRLHVRGPGPTAAAPPGGSGAPPPPGQGGHLVGCPRAFPPLHHAARGKKRRHRDASPRISLRRSAWGWSV